ncbi:hypothetical protein bcgnr5372_25980 [Bacillus luti]
MRWTVSWLSIGIATALLWYLLTYHDDPTMVSFSHLSTIFNINELTT